MNSGLDLSVCEGTQLSALNFECLLWILLIRRSLKETLGLATLWATLVLVSVLVTGWIHYRTFHVFFSEGLTTVF